MITLKKEHGLLFSSLNFEIDDYKFTLNKVMIDTGCAKTIINSDYLPINGTETINFAFGVGGRETILDRDIKQMKVNGFPINKTNINLGEMDYGLDIDCILGLDILESLNAIINLNTLQLEFK